MTLQIERNVTLAEHCRFRVGGPADYFARVEILPELEQVLQFARRQGCRYFVYGGGSNLFFDDRGFRGLVLRVHGGTVSQPTPEGVVTVSAGVELPAFVRQLAQWDRGGLEFLGNIPGSVGGAVVGNAGCYGKAIGDVLLVADVYDAEMGAVETLTPDQLGFAYRHSRLKDEPHRIVLSVQLLTQGRRGEVVQNELADELRSRLEKHPHEAWCAGSFFKNPSRERPAWRVITEAGVAQSRVGGAALSAMHANFLINEGGATSADIIALVRIVQTAVRERLGLEISPEVRYVGPEGIVEL